MYISPHTQRKKERERETVKEEEAHGAFFSILAAKVADISIGSGRDKLTVVAESRGKNLSPYFLCVGCM